MQMELGLTRIKHHGKVTAKVGGMGTPPDGTPKARHISSMERHILLMLADIGWNRISVYSY